MKIDERPPAGPLSVPSGAVEPGEAPAAHVGVDPEVCTRDRVCRAVLERGPIAAPELARALGLTPAAVRRHLDVLLEQGLVTLRDAPARVRRGRGRPARLFVLTDAGHAAMATGYDDLAAQALRYLTRVAGPDAVRRFADERLAGIEARYRPVVEAAGPDPRARAEVLAGMLSADGFAAGTRALAPAAGGAAGGTQLCQGHCPVQHVAREFPELCEAETDTFSRLLGVHVQRLATLAHGEHVCTTHVPGRPPDQRSGGRPTTVSAERPATPRAARSHQRSDQRSDER